MTLHYPAEIIAQFISKSITVEKLRELLDELKPTDELYPNSVGNLAVYREYQYFGYVDIGAETVEIN